ncbi:MAG: DUF2272 domain-containing protein [Lautropia sp.]
MAGGSVASRSAGRAVAVAAAMMAVVLAVLGLPACIGVAPGGTAHDPNTSGRLPRLLAVARAAWHDWGEQTVVVARDGRFCALIDGDCTVVDDGCGLEQAPAQCPLVDDYWDSVRGASGIHFAHDCSRAPVCRARWPADAVVPPIDTPAWSAAFISTMMARAGFDRAAFRQTPYHADYVVAARDRSTWAFDLVPTPARAEPGDLVCTTRFAKRPQLTPAEIDRILPSTVPGGPTPMHCDLVIAVDPAAHRLDAVGGNVMQAVSRVVIDLDDDGRVSPVLNPARPWLLVLKLAPRYRPSH